MKNSYNIEPKSDLPDSEHSTTKVTLLPRANHTSSVSRLVQKLLPGEVLSKSKILLLAWLVALIALSQILSALQYQSSHFFGLVDGREQSVSFQYPVEIVSLSVVEGEQISVGRQILQVKRHDLNTQTEIIATEISEVKLQHQEYLATTTAKIKSLKSQQLAESAALDRKIKRLATRYRLNKELSSQLINQKTAPKGRSNVLLVELNSLKDSRRHTYNRYQAEIDNLKSQLASNTRPANAKISNLEKQQSELLRQHSALSVTAKFDGNVGSILFKIGEMVKPFKSIMTLHSSSQNIVKGYIHESILNDVAIDQIVWVKSFSSNQSELLVEGKVKSLGKRIIAYPDRLKRSRDVAAFGREVIIELQHKNPLLLSEKVIILLQAEESLFSLDSFKRLVSQWTVFSSAKADIREYDSSVDTDASSIHKRRSLSPILSRVESLIDRQIEASGVILDISSGNFLLISDESDIKPTVVYEMNLSGAIIAVRELENLNKIDDMESISQDNHHVYILASLSADKSGQSKKKRGKFVKLKSTDNGFRLVKAINFKRTLNRLIKSDDTSGELRELISTAIKNKTLDIEAHAVVNNQLYIGLKEPVDDNSNSLILKVDDVNSVFQNKTTSIKLWHSLDFSSITPSLSWRLSDFIFIDDRVLLLTVGNKKNHHSSALWSFDIAEQKLELKEIFQHARAEGISMTSRPGSFMIVFDGGGYKPSQYYLVDEI